MFDFLDPYFLVKSVGLLGVTLIIFAESGLFFGFFFPGDSLLFTAGIIASAGLIDIGWLLLLTFAAAVLGDSVGYAFGVRVGPKLFSREDSLFFHKKHLDRTRFFYERHGRKTIVLARFVPVVRTFAPILAGVGRMPYRTFLFYNLSGGFFWVVIMVTLGYFLGTIIPNPDRYIWPLVAGIIVISFLPGLPAFLKHWKERRGVSHPPSDDKSITS